ncbi:hypothetical protein [Methylobacterium brachiatum]|uniref:DUF7940 domain-containing protein n=1 Tax=Methylobacterium brachiatum TaxID=269660 RepID=UPI00244D3AA0|nr:hypothetical protein [Methylobacterium brachiatum]MDH2313170.1 hypothetical protein [Methylobacterium brachiatum]
MSMLPEAGVLARLHAAIAARLHELAVPNWRQVLRHAWSVQLDMLGIVLTVLQAGVDVLSGNPPIDPVKFAVLAMAISGLSLLLRFVRQDKVSGGA